MNQVTAGITYYKNPETLAYQLKLWKEVPQHLLENIEIIVVDDGSPKGKRAEEIIQRDGLPNCRFQLLRIVVDMPWNQGQGRNLIFKLARNPWIFATDIDNGLTATFFDGLLAAQLDPKTIYHFKRIEHYSRQPIKFHSETRMMTQQMFWERIGPFDESCTGHYCFIERNWMWRVRDSTVTQAELPIALEHLPSYVINDSETRGLPRKDDRDDDAWQDIIDWKRANGIGYQCLKHPWKVVLTT